MTESSERLQSRGSLRAAEELEKNKFIRDRKEHLRPGIKVRITLDDPDATDSDSDREEYFRGDNHWCYRRIMKRYIWQTVGDLVPDETEPESSVQGNEDGNLVPNEESGLENPLKHNSNGNLVPDETNVENPLRYACENLLPNVDRILVQDEIMLENLTWDADEDLVPFEANPENPFWDADEDLVSDNEASLLENPLPDEIMLEDFMWDANGNPGAENSLQVDGGNLVLQEAGLENPLPDDVDTNLVPDDETTLENFTWDADENLVLDDTVLENFPRDSDGKIILDETILENCIGNMDGNRAPEETKSENSLRNTNGHLVLNNNTILESSIQDNADENVVPGEISAGEVVYKKTRKGSTKYRGVRERNGKFIAEVGHGSKRDWLGTFKTEEEAVKAYTPKRLEYDMIMAEKRNQRSLLRKLERERIHAEKRNKRLMKKLESERIQAERKNKGCRSRKRFSPLMMPSSTPPSSSASRHENEAPSEAAEALDEQATNGVENVNPNNNQNQGTVNGAGPSWRFDQCMEYVFGELDEDVLMEFNDEEQRKWFECIWPPRNE